MLKQRSSLFWTEGEHDVHVGDETRDDQHAEYRIPLPIADEWSRNFFPGLGDPAYATAPKRFDRHGVLWGALYAPCVSWQFGPVLALWSLVVVDASGDPIDTKFYEDLDGGLSASEVQALAQMSRKKRAQHLQRAKSYAALPEAPLSVRRQPIPDAVKIFVWQRDEGQCVRCATGQSLEFDHIIPLAMGGSNTERNLQLLCEGCNRAKGASIV